MRELQVRRLGVVPYDAALAMQRQLVEERRAGHIPDLLLLLQHPAVITLGVKGDGGRANIVATDARLAELGIAVHETGRGGDVTYHGPGQIVGYPILDLKPDRCDVHRYVRDLEDVMIRVCADYGVTAGRIKGLTGAWVGAEKIGAIGVRLSRWITMHGFALNLTTDLSLYRSIVPCGVTTYGVCSLASLGAAAPEPSDLGPLAWINLASRLGRAPAPFLDGSDVPDSELSSWLIGAGKASRVA
jgi:lipoyl(octanoyl) transferase